MTAYERLPTRSKINSKLSCRVRQGECSDTGLSKPLGRGSPVSKRWEKHISPSPCKSPPEPFGQHRQRNRGRFYKPFEILVRPIANRARRAALAQLDNLVLDWKLLQNRTRAPRSLPPWGMTSVSQRVEMLWYRRWAWKTGAEDRYCRPAGCTQSDSARSLGSVRNWVFDLTWTVVSAIRVSVSSELRLV